MGWLWLLLTASFSARYIQKNIVQWVVRLLIVLAGLVSIAWPVLHYQLSVLLVAELVVIFLVAGILFFFLKSSSNYLSKYSPHHRSKKVLQSIFQQGQSASPAFTMTINTTGLAISSVLSGSPILAQLATALADFVGAYTIYELFYRLKKLYSILRCYWCFYHFIWGC